MNSLVTEKPVGVLSWQRSFVCGLFALGFVLVGSATAQRDSATANTQRAYADCGSCGRGRSLYALHRPPGRSYYVWPYSRRYTRRIDRYRLRAETLGLPAQRLWTEYDRGFTDGVRYADELARIDRRRERLAANYEELMQAGLAAFRISRYEGAAWHFSTAADINRGDASSRLLAGQAWLALGEYDEAAGHIRRALELQPHLPGLPLDLRKEYGRREDFAEHVAALQAEAREKENDPQLWWLLGYEQFFSGQRSEARSSFRRAYALAPNDGLPAKFLPTSDRKRRQR